MALSLTFNPRAVAEKGEEIYRRKYKTDYEAKYLGDFVVVDVVTEDAFRGRTPEDAHSLARRTNKGPFHLLKVGEAGAFRVSYCADGEASAPRVVLQ